MTAHDSPRMSIFRRPRVLASLFTLALLAGGMAAWRWYADASKPPPTFSGDAAQLKQTVVVPTLDTPMPKGKNVIWCASFQLAWNRLRDDVIKEPVQLNGVQDIADRLNRTTVSDADLPAASSYAVAGYVKDGIENTIRREMTRRFPGAPLPTFPAARMPEDIAAYGYLQVDVPFTHKYIETPNPVTFLDSSCTTTPIASFGIPEKYHPRSQLLNQPEISFIDVVLDDTGRSFKEFSYAIKLERDADTEVILACIKPGKTLNETINTFEEKAAAWKGRTTFTTIDVLTVPNFSWDITRNYHELTGRLLTNADFSGYRVAEATQSIQFRLNKGGASLRSKAQLYMSMSAGIDPDWHNFNFTRPFLLILKQRDAQHPFFAMWVDNAELLQRMEDKGTVNTNSMYCSSEMERMESGKCCVCQKDGYFRLRGIDRATGKKYLACDNIECIKTSYKLIHPEVDKRNIANEIQAK